MPMSKQSKLILLNKKKKIFILFDQYNRLDDTRKKTNRMVENIAIFSQIILAGYWFVIFHYSFFWSEIIIYCIHFFFINKTFHNNDMVYILLKII